MRPISMMAVSVLALLSAPALAQTDAAAGKVLEGRAAFGNWRADAPGVTRHLTAQDLDAPNATPSASNAPANVAMADGARPKVPDGFKVEMVASGIDNPRAIRFAPNGDLFVANSQDDQVLVYRFEGDNATLAAHGIFATDKLNQPYGIAFYPAGDTPQWVYVANADGLVRFPYNSGDLKATGAPEVLFDTIPPEHHWTRDVVFSADGKTMYYSVGSGSNAGERTMDKAPEGGVEAWAKAHPVGVAWGGEERRADVLAFDPDGKNERYFATGLRNCAGMTLQPATGATWCVVNNVDGLGDNVPFEFATSLKDGAFYGWPWYYIGANPDPRWSDAPRPDLKDRVTVPDVLFQAHSAPLNIAFYDNDAWGPDYKGDAFVTMHGSWNRDTRTGYKVVRLDFDAAGKPTGTYQDFMTGFVLSDQEVWGRPVGVAVAKDGSLFVSEDGNGTIWRVSRQ